MPVLTIRIDDETRARIGEAAERLGLTTSDYVRQALDDQLSVDDGGVLEERPGSHEALVLTPVERKILQLLHRSILAAKGDLHGSYYDAEAEVRSIQALEGGFVGEYATHEFADLSEPMTHAECELVWDIFDMFRILQFSVRELGEDGWGGLGLDRAEDVGTFQGFDLNDALESRLLLYARYLVKTERWEEQKEALGRENDGGNSHMPMLSRYRAMLREFKPRWKQAIRGSGFRAYLPVDDLRNILIAGGAKPTDA